MKEMVSGELASFDGKDGRPVYVAFQGKVYDVTRSRLWSSGSHMKRHPSGKDLTREILAAPHGPEVLERYPQVAMVKAPAEPPGEELKHLPPWLQTALQKFPLLKRHPHPMVVHFPIAFLMAASFFALLLLLHADPTLELTSFCLLILGAIATPFAMGTGYLTWWINYMRKPNRFIQRKIWLSFPLLGLEVVLILWRELCPAVFPPTIHPPYLILMLFLAPLVGLIGYYGGQLTFPEP